MTVGEHNDGRVEDKEKNRTKAMQDDKVIKKTQQDGYIQNLTKEKRCKREHSVSVLFLWFTAVLVITGGVAGNQLCQ